MKNYFKKIIKELSIEIIELGQNKTFGLKWGEGRIAEILGFNRKDIIKSLDWADRNPLEAERIIKEVYSK